MSPGTRRTDATISGGFAAPAKLACPFCGAPETDRIEVDGNRFLVFQCMFTPQVDPTLPDAALGEHLRKMYEGQGERYFRSMCDRMHLFVTKGEGARAIGGSGSAARRSTGARPP
jgi:hypothetical protein